VRNRAKAAGLERAGVELVEGDLADAASLGRALAGVERAFVVTPVARESVGWFGNFFDAAKRAGVGRVVKFSAMGAGPDAASEIMRQHGESDRMLMESGLGYTILRPNSFFQNVLWSAGTIKTSGQIFLPMADARLSMVDVGDIADVAAAALTGDGHAGQTYEITGEEALSFSDVAAVLSRVLGRPVTYVPVPGEAARQGMIQAGMPAWEAGAVTELYDAFTTGVYARTTDTVRRVLGRPAVRFEEFVRRNAAAFA
jgi:uncharacterized protein YbjT (DUF2867 family)